MKKATVYIFADGNNSIIKVGVTRLDVKFRISTLKSASQFIDFECVYQREFDSSTAYKVEKVLLKELFMFGSPLSQRFDGSTECALVNDKFANCVWHLVSKLESIHYEPTVQVTPENVVGDIVIPSWLVETQFVAKNKQQETPLMLTLADKMVYCAATSACEISQKDLASSLRVSISLVEKSVRRLVDSGMLEVRRFKSGSGCIKSNAYYAKEDFIILG